MKSSRAPARHLGMLGVVVALVVTLTTSAAAAGITRCVKPGGADGCDASIQSAVDAAASLGATVSSALIDVHPGVYAEAVDVPAGAVLTIRGVGPASSQIVDGSTTAAVAVFLAARGDTRIRRTRLTLVDLTITGGSRGIEVGQRADLLVQRCLVHDNAGNGVAVLSRATIVDSDVFANGRGAQVGWHAAATLRGTSVRDNGGIDVYGGGIDVHGGRVTLENCTVSGNQGVVGAGIRANLVNGNFPTFPRIDIRYSTIASNTATWSGGGIQATGDARRIRLQGALIADNVAPSEPDCATSFYPPLLDRGSSLVETPGSCLAVPSTRSFYGVDPMLGPLADNGGPGWTHLPAPGSPARGVAIRACPRNDQRGVLRARPCTIGAVE